MTKRLESKRSCIKISNKKHHQQHTNCHSKSHQKINNSLKNIHSTNQKLYGQIHPDQDVIKDLLKDSYIFVRQENQSLNQKIAKKNKKIDELKLKIHEYQSKMRSLEEQINSTLGRTKSVSHQQSTTKESQECLHSSRKKYQHIIRQSQKIAKKTLEKYKILEQEIETQKLQFQAEIAFLKDENINLRTQKSNQKTEETSRKRIAKSQSKKKLDFQVLNEKDLNEKLQMYRQKQMLWCRKEQELKQYLTEITSKLNLFEKSMKSLERECKGWQHKYEDLSTKAKTRAMKYRQGSAEWGNIFKDLIKETKSLEDEIEKLRNIFYRLIKKELQRVS